MEIRFQNLSLSAELQRAVDDDAETDATHELPTIPNTLRKTLRRVTAHKDRVTKHILRNVSGVLTPGTMTLVLGQPGSGKSALMKLLSGRFPMSSNVRLSGDVTYNGGSRDVLLSRLPQVAAYVGQRDVHFPTLSVQETLAFAHACSGAGHTLDKTELQDERDPSSNTILEQLGLQHCQHTVVGDGTLRGVSGGERKRVTLGEMQFGDRAVSFLDEISTGLDSAATFDIIRTQRALATTLRRTVVVALLQPSPEVFALFDDVLILNDGYVIYHGPRDQVIAYFHSLGFDCAPTRDQADFLVDLGTPQQVQHETPRIDGRSHPRTAREFAELFEKSVIYAANLRALQAPWDPALVKAREDHVDRLPLFHQSFAGSLVTLVMRQLQLTVRNTQYIYVRAFMVIAVSLVLASLFWQFDPRDIQVVMGVSFQGILFLDLGQVLQLPIYMGARDVFYKQRGANFFRTSTYVLASSIAQIPIAAFETLVFSSLLYWMCGFVSVFSSYVIFVALVFLTNMVLAAFFFVMAAVCKDLNTATPASLVAIMLVTIFSGFIVSKDQIPGFLSWLYWINPITWCVRGVAINQYTSASLNVNVFDGVNYMATYGKPMGEYLLTLFGIDGGRAWVGISFAVLAGMYVLFLTTAWLVLEYVRYESPEQVQLSDEDKQPLVVRQMETAAPDFALLKTPRGENNAEVVVQVDAAAPAYVHDFMPVTVAFQDLWYSVPNPANPKEELHLLKGVSGFAVPGTITALMGSSGAGKTTLMDVIAGRKTGGTIRGQILLNGHAVTDLAIRRSTGYCEQMDVHSESATFREALTFSAFLRQDATVPNDRKLASVDECLDLLDLHPIADQIIRGSSVEQMKRLTIGVELAAQPSVLFLDEPTSGLDARAAKMIMDGVRKVADTGRTVLCTIHQPSWEVFQVFDSLLLLKRGGETVYFSELGENANQLVRYFETIDGVAPLPVGYNPATWMLEVIGAGVDTSRFDAVDFASVFQSSNAKRQLELRLMSPGMTSASPNVPALTFSNKRAASHATQATFLLQRFRDLYWRTPSYNITRFVVVIFFAVVFGLTYVDAEYDTYQGINSGQGLMYYASLFLGIVSFNSVIPLTVQERPSFYRERAAQTYSAWWYFVAGTLVELPYIFSSCFVFTAIFFPLVGFSGTARFFMFWLNLALYVVQQTYWAQVLVYALPSIEVTSTVGMFVLSVAVLFAGYNPPASAIPAAYKWVYYLTSHTYTLAILSATVFGDCSDTVASLNATSTELACQTIKNLPPTLPANLTIKQYVEQVFLMKHDEIWVNFAAVIGFIVLVRLMALLALRFLNFQKR